MSECTREFTEEEIEADRMAKMTKEIEPLKKEMEHLRKEMEHLRMENESLREVIAWLNIKMLNQEKDRRW